MTQTQFIHDAINNWPEDEATLSAEFALDLYASEGHDYYHQWLMRERDHFWNTVFEKDSELMDRFTESFNKLTSKITNLYI
jgi:hypothetical protein